MGILNSKTYEKYIRGRRHFWMRPGALAVILGVVFIPMLITPILYLAFFFLFRISFFELYSIVFLITAALFMAMWLYKPSFPLKVREEIVAVPSKHAWSISRGRASPTEDKTPSLHPIIPFKVDLRAYILGKVNRNVLTAGTSGQGKSKLARHLLGIFPERKIIFSFKPNDEYLRLGYKIADASLILPNPFANPDAFTSAFLVAFPVTAVGIQAGLAPSLLGRLCKQSGSWGEFTANAQQTLRSAKDANSRAALVFIATNAERLAYKTGSFSIGSEDVVLDFSKLNSDARSFYAELVLRQLYSAMESRRAGYTLICVDEAHRLTGSSFGKYHTIMVEMSREIRDKGMLWAVTQNYTDIPDYIRNQFATQFTFRTTSQADTTALRSISTFLSWTATSLPSHYFIDANFQNMHSFIPLYCYNPSGERDSPATYLKRRGEESVAERGEKPIDFAREIEGILAEQPAYASQIGRIISEKFGITKDKAKLGVKAELAKLLANDAFGRIRMSKGGRAIIVYYAKTGNLSGLHAFMQREVAEALKAKGIKILEQSRPGKRSSPDIETAGLSIEVETGLKHDRIDLENRILKSQKRVIIVVPNEDLIDRYKKFSSDRLEVVTLGEFDSVLKG